MIYTVTLNPSIDFIVRIDKVEIGEVNRMDSDDKFAGGKGINVSRILQRLGIDNTATGFIGGFTGRFVTDGLDAEGIKTKFVAVDQDTRINVKIKADQETEINGTGPIITEEQLAELEAILSSITADDVVVFAGSAPSNLGNKVYNKLIPLVRETGAQVVCDFEGQTLLDSLAHQPLLVKPNNHELEAISMSNLMVFLMLKNMHVKSWLRGRRMLSSQWLVMGHSLLHQRLLTLPNQLRGQLKTLLVRVTQWLLVSLVSLLNQVTQLRRLNGEWRVVRLQPSQMTWRQLNLLKKHTIK